MVDAEAEGAASRSVRRARGRAWARGRTRTLLPVLSLDLTVVLLDLMIWMSLGVVTLRDPRAAVSSRRYWQRPQVRVQVQVQVRVQVRVQVEPRAWSEGCSSPSLSR